MGTRGASGVKEALLGSNTAKVLQKVGCVMITVPVGWKMKGLNKLAFATDYQGLNNPMEFSVVKALLDHYKPDLDLLNIKSDEAMKVDRDAENNWRNLLSDHSFNDISIEGEEITELITKYVEETKPDMLIMVSRRRGFIDRLLRKSVTRKLSMHLNVPIMVLHDNQDSSKE
jgi:nucleotide-binding universal stress UspA family protein